MKDKIRKLAIKGIDINVLKIIAIVAMIIDHVGYYFQSFLPHPLYTIFRITGRIAMPIFVYSVVQGFFHTKNFKEYLKRISILAIVTQLSISMLGILNIYFVKDYIVTAYKHGNILFSFSLGLILLYFIHNKIVIKKWDFNKNMILKIFYVVLLIAIYIFIPIDYEFQVVLLMVMLYFIEKLRITTYLSRQGANFNMKKVIATTIKDEKIKLINNVMITLSLLLIIIYMNANIYMLLALPFIWLYNGEKNDSRYINSNIFYYVFPIHHILFYTVALVLTVF